MASRPFPSTTPRVTSGFPLPSNNASCQYDTLKGLNTRITPPPVAASCSACCRFRGLGYSEVTWSKMSVVPITVGTEVVVIDDEHNRTSTTTEFITTSISRFGPDKWIQNGTYYQPPTPTTPKTATIPNFTTGATYTYPIGTQAIPTGMFWEGSFAYDAGTGPATCLTNNGTLSPVPSPSSIPVLRFETDPEDPYGQFYTPIPVTRPLVPTLWDYDFVRTQYPESETLIAVYNSCYSGLGPAPAVAASTASFLLDRSTRKGFVAAPETTTSQGPAPSPMPIAAPRPTDPIPEVTNNPIANPSPPNQSAGPLVPAPSAVLPSAPNTPIAPGNPVQPESQQPQNQQSQPPQPRPQAQPPQGVPVADSNPNLGAIIASGIGIAPQPDSPWSSVFDGSIVIINGPSSELPLPAIETAGSGPVNNAAPNIVVGNGVATVQAPGTTQVLHPGDAPKTIAGQAFSLAPDGQSVVRVGPSNQAPATANVPTYQSGVRVNPSSQGPTTAKAPTGQISVVLANGVGYIEADGATQTIRPNGDDVTVAGTIYSLPSGGRDVVIVDASRTTTAHIPGATKETTTTSPTTTDPTTSGPTSTRSTVAQTTGSGASVSVAKIPAVWVVWGLMGLAVRMVL